MKTAEAKDHDYLQKATEAAIRIGLVATLITLCLLIVMPFLKPVVWGVILAVAIYPLFKRLTKSLGGRKKISATLVVTIALALLLVPTILFLGSITERLIDVAKGLSEGTLSISSPPESVAEWPVIGKKVHGAWTTAEADLPAFLSKNATQVKTLGAWVLTSAADLTMGVLAFAFSILIAGVLLATAEGGTRASESIGERLAGRRGVELVQTSAATIRSVAVGVVGVALIQSFLAAIGFVAAGVPAAGVWALLVMVLAIAQLPPLIVLLPAIIYVFSTGSTTVGIIFAIWAGFVGVSDNILKPLLLGRGVKVPMLVILIGSLGGMISMGILGLFIGAVVLAVGHQIYLAWASELRAEPADAES